MWVLWTIIPETPPPFIIPSFSSDIFTSLFFANIIHHITRSIFVVVSSAGSGVVTGWGNTREDGQSSDVLMKVVVPIISDNQCRQNYLAIGYNGPITNNMICAGYSRGGKDACQVNMLLSYFLLAIFNPLNSFLMLIPLLAFFFIFMVLKSDVCMPLTLLWHRCRILNEKVYYIFNFIHPTFWSTETTFLLLY